MHFQMRVGIPRWLVWAWDKLGDWSNVTVYERGKIEVRRLDIMLAVFGVGGFVYYFVVYNWQMAVLSVLTYAMVLMIAMWII